MVKYDPPVVSFAPSRLCGEVFRMKSLDQKLARIRAGNYTPADFIMADAKDPDMAFGIACPGPARDTSGRLLDHLATRPVFLQTMRDMTNSGLIDIMLTSVSTSASISDSFSISRNVRICFCISAMLSSFCSMENSATAISIVAGSIGIVAVLVAVNGPADWSCANFDEPSAHLNAPQKFPFRATFSASPTPAFAR